VIKKSVVCSCSGPKRANYYFGMLLTADDFKDEQEYFQKKFRQHNRATFCQGVIKGLKVSCSKNCVSITPGFAMDAAGRLLELSETCNFSLAEDSGVWDLVIELVEEPCDPVQTAIPVTNTGNEISFSRIQEIVKVWAVKVTARNEEKIASNGVWLGRVQLRNGQGQVTNEAVKKESPDGYK